MCLCIWYFFCFEAFVPFTIPASFKIFNTCRLMFVLRLFFPFVFVYCLIFSSRIFSNTYCHIQTSTSSADFFRSTTRLCQIAVWWKRKKSERSNSSDLLMKSTKAVATTFHPCHQQFVIEFLVCNSCGRRNVFNSNTLSHYF